MRAALKGRVNAKSFGAAEIDAAVSALREEGYVVLEDVVEDALVARLRDRIRELIASEPPAKEDTSAGPVRGSSSHRVRNLVSRDDAFREAALHPPVDRINETLLGAGYLLFASAVNEVGPGEKPQRLHTDDVLIRFPRPFPEPLLLNSLWALGDFTAANGATRLVPRSHLSGGPCPPEADTLQPEMGAGSILLYHGSVWHGASANRTADSWRLAMIFTYCARFIRPYENQLKLIPLDRARQMPAKLRQLIGFDYVIDADIRK